MFNLFYHQFKFQRKGTVEFAWNQFWEIRIPPESVRKTQKKTMVLFID